jgi:hypothetical protein
MERVGERRIKQLAFDCEGKWGKSKIIVIKVLQSGIATFYPRD